MNALKVSHWTTQEQIVKVSRQLYHLPFYHKYRLAALAHTMIGKSSAEAFEELKVSLHCTSAAAESEKLYICIFFHQMWTSAAATIAVSTAVRT